MQAAGFLELQRRFQRDAHAETAAHHEQVVRFGQAFAQQRPVLLPAGAQRIGQWLQGVAEVVTAMPAGAQVKDGGQRGEIALGCRHAALGPGMQRNHRVGQLRQRRILHVDHRHHARAGLPGRLGVAQQVGAFSRLRNGQEQCAVPALLGRIYRRHRGRRGGGNHAQLGLEHVLGIGRRVVGAAARASDNEARRRLAQRLGERGDHGLVGGKLARDHIGGLMRFAIHQGVAGVEGSGVH